MKIRYDTIRKELSQNRRNLAIIVAFVSLFEIFMIIRAVQHSNFEYLRPRLYFIAYIVLLFFSLLGLVLLLSKRITPAAFEKYGIYYLYFYVTLIILWSILISCLDISHGNTAIVYLTVVVSILVFCVIDPIYYCFLSLLGTIIVSIIQFRYSDGNSFFLINIGVYSMVTIIGGIRMYKSVILRHTYSSLLVEQSNTDALTNIKNRRALDNDIKELKMTDKDFVLVLLDLDNFKQANDHFGHKFGDDCLNICARNLESLFGKEYSYRFGGDEFAAISFLSNEEIIVLVEKLNSLLLEATSQFKLCVSAGIYKVKKEDSEIDLFVNADKYLYEAKNSDLAYISSNK